MGVAVTLPYPISGHSPAAWVSVCEGTNRPPLETALLGLHVGAQVTASLSYFPAQPCVWACFVLGFFALFCFIQFCFSLPCRAGCCGLSSGKGCPGAGSLPQHHCRGLLRGTGSAGPPSESTLCLLTDLVVLLVNVPAFPCKEQLAQNPYGNGK